MSTFVSQKTAGQHRVPVNDVLAMFRTMHGHRVGNDLAQAAGAWLNSLMSMTLAGSFTMTHAKFARRVLSRLAGGAR